MPVQIKVLFTDGSDTLIKVINDINHQLFEFNFSKRPGSVILLILTYDPAQTGNYDRWYPLINKKK